MNKESKVLLQIPQLVIDDTLGFREKLNDFLNGQTSDVKFRAIRVPMGIYEQRKSGNFMARIRIGAGLVLPYQLCKIAELSKKYGNSIVHITTRQDIQIHNLKIKDTADVLEQLLDANLSTRGGGGNTVRNVSACPRAGICPTEIFDVAPYAIAVTEYLIQSNASFNLPRKYKIAFSGCSDDCALASVADLGFFAHIKNDIKGFSVYAGGGLGANSSVAVKIEDFIKDDEVFEVAEAVKRLFDKHGDRSNKHKARLRYVLARVGVDEFIKLYREERNALKANGLPFEAPNIRDLSLDYPVSKESATIQLWLENGVILADDLNKVGQIAARYGQGIVRTTQLQDLLITGVDPKNVSEVNEELKGLSVNVFSNGRPKVVSCAGASTCKLGLCLSRGLSEAISNRLCQANLPDTVIRISGCPNSCGHDKVAKIGFQGKAKRVNGRLLPCYDVLVGATVLEGETKLAEKIGTVPAKKIPDLLFESLSDGSINKELLRSLTAKYGEINEESLPEDYYYDWGSDEPFSLAGRGPGECGAGVLDVIQLDVSEAKDAIKATPTTNESIYKAIVASTKSLLVTFGLEPKKDREIFAAFSEHIIKPGWVKPETQQLLDSALDWKMGDLDTIDDLLPIVKDLVNRVEKLSLSLDANLKFKIEPIVQHNEVKISETKNNTIDLCGVACPMNFVKAKLELTKIQIGDILEVLLDEGGPAENVPVSLAKQGQEILEVKKVDNYYCIKVRRRK